ncbi:MAG: hypothetical protein AAFV87_07945, partial [Pseudomonadota bacterium]
MSIQDSHLLGKFANEAVERLQGSCCLIHCRSPTMLIGLNPLLSPDLLRALRAMGHGDDIAIV